MGLFMSRGVLVMEEINCLRQGAGFLEQQDLNFGDRFRMECLQTLQGYVSVLIASRTIEPFAERIPWPLYLF